MRRLLGVVLVVLALPVAAQAYVPPGATIVSASLELREQGDEPSGAPDISADGRFVVFETRARNLFGPDFADPRGAHYDGGVMRRDVASGRLELIAPGDLIGDDGTVRVRGARNPSISADGRYVVFSTAEKLVPADTNGNIDVYLRDVDAGRYELISARDGGDASASYGVRDPDLPGRNPGADVSPGVAISDDGDRVLFRSVDIDSDLPDAASPTTPPYQLFVRTRSTKRTTLLTRDMTTGEPVGGASAGGALSADGTTVAWPGTAAERQTRMLAGEISDASIFYYLWRRVDGGATRRITGPVEPDLPECTSYPGVPTVVDGCTGPLSDREQYAGTGITGTLPALSADGYRVAFITGAPPRPSILGVTQDLWVTDMHEGVTRTAGSRELTREGTNKDPADASAISSVALSPDGRWAAIVTQRTRFLLPALRLVDAPTTAVGIDELYLIDLATGDIQRALRSTAGGNADGAVGNALSLSDGGRRIAFVSSADNLFFGDANQRADVFVIDRADAPPPAPVEQEPPAELPAESFDPPPPVVAKLRVTVRKAPKGRVRLLVRAPDKGKFAIAVRGRLPDDDGRLRGAAKLLGSSTKSVKKKGAVTLDVKLASKYAALARRNKKLDGSATVTFTPVSGAPLSGTTTVRFSAPPKKK
ncbi:PD40 domain-containing protein [Solirubrobacter soli]|uniref:PD40 domain-containing protein n=1 Tax=Solirubrobacter soli TaxID=363832 RepID=UPI00047F017B|nr:PD40 domain-containing protein [Solirubrobacter soli]